MTLLVNDDTPRVSEKEPNDGFKNAMPVAASQIVEASFRQAQWLQENSYSICWTFIPP